VRTIKILSIALAAIFLAGGPSVAGDQNEVGALLVYPIVASTGDDCAPPSCEDQCEEICAGECGEDGECYAGCLPSCTFDCEGGPSCEECDGFCADTCGEDEECYSFCTFLVCGALCETFVAETPTSAPKNLLSGGGTSTPSLAPKAGPSAAPKPQSASTNGESCCEETALIETFLTITNAGQLPVVAHFTYFDGNEQDLVGTYCEECNFSVPLTGNDTETLVLSTVGTSTVIRSEDSDIEMSCPFPFGMIVATIESTNGTTLTDNVLLGDAVIVNYSAGSAYSVPAIAFQGGNGNGDRVYNFDDEEYSRLPRIVAANFLAPQAGAGAASLASLNLFTLDFDRHHAPLTDCSVTGYDADEKPFSSSFQFGCWTMRDLCEISPEFCHPNLGLVGGGDTHGWVQLNCKVDRDPDMHDGFETNGGVHGTIVQQRSAGMAIPAGGSNVLLTGQAAWASVLYQSVTTGDATTLMVETPSPGME
jgi:hypothetical protein